PESEAQQLPPVTVLLHGETQPRSAERAGPHLDVPAVEIASARDRNALEPAERGFDSYQPLVSWAPGLAPDRHRARPRDHKQLGVHVPPWCKPELQPAG